ncbi:putative autophagy regulatory protein Atg2 [Aspergillus chevalieri]|uniref:Autophagy-related protein 2 n=1 Tax=Aspergillus chevalieri TaxID=182096 RepID=A0A7R7ZID5_ASPCH|nr:autophagy-related protein 2 [Aspergillus chevalieri]BCR83148.1 autophagy-related protein 2 [Aspergillus chevalieri]
MASFLPSFFQKRLLRYALSRLELVDTEALDLDSLGIRWGQRSTVELRDIGLRLEKLASFLHLPPSSELLSARVRFLKITVPADIYSSGIVCEASGIEVHLRILSEETKPSYHDRKLSTTAQDATDDQILPTPTDLAQSFLETEPKEEKDELQAAISSRSQVLQQRSSTSLSDDEEELGLGNESLSLPSFVAAFLKGIADRLQVRVNDIAIRVDMELKQDGPAKRQPEEEPDLVTAVLSVREVKVDGVSMTSSDDASHARTEGKRAILVSDINMILVSDPVIFSNYSRFAASLTPDEMTQSKSSQLPSRAPSPPLSESSGNSNLAMTRSTIFETRNESQEEEPEQPGTPRPTAPQMEASTYTYDGRFSDADSEGDGKGDRYLQDLQNLADDGILDNPDYLDSVINTQYDDDDIEGASRPWPRGEQRYTDSETTSCPPSPQLHFSESMPRESDLGEPGTAAGMSASHEWAPDAHGSVHDSQAGLGITDSAVHRTGFSELPHLSDSSLTDGYPEEQPPSHTSSPPSEAGSTGSHPSSSNGDLSESKFFSHEEAQSMYMSAISQGSGSRSFMPAMPGAWDSESTVFRPNPVREAASREEQEESVSTPKLSGQPGPFTQAQEQINLEARSETTEKGLGQSTPELTKVTGVAKRFFSADQVLIWIPSVEKSTEGGEDTPAESRRDTYEDLEESTADLRESRVEDDLLTSRIYDSTRHRPGTSRRPGEPCPDLHDEHKTIAVEVFSVDLQFDIATGWLLTKMGQKVVQAFASSEKQPQPPKKGHQSEQPQGRQAINLSLKKLSIKFVEHLHGHAYPADGTGLNSSQSFGPSIEDIVLQAAASGLQARFAMEKDTTNLHLDISKFTLGFASDSLISFDESLKMRESTRDIMAPTHGEISLFLSKSPDSARINLTTLPLLVNFNIQRLEEVFGFLGGLSTILELGSSISSVSTVKGTKQEPPPPKRPRGVHFETAPPPASVEPDHSTPWKVNARVGGIVLDVVGESHCLKLRSTALKMVSRSEGIGVQVDKAKLSGPFLIDGSQDAPAKVSLTNIRVEYLFTPKEVDLDRLLALITPSKDKYDEDDDIMLDTLFRQRRQGSVLRVTVAEMKTVVSQIKDLNSISQLGNELGRFSSMAKYFPEDDRPGLFILALVKEVESQVHVGGQVGDISAHLRNAEAAYISIPSLISAQIGTMGIIRNGEEELLGEALPLSRGSQDHTLLPVLMARFIADEMEPAVKIKLHNLRAEYTIPSVMAFLGFSEDMTRGDVASNMANSLANLAEAQESHHAFNKSPIGPDSPKGPVKPTRLALDLRDCVIGLNPRNTPARGLVVLTNAKFSGTIHGPESSDATLDLRKASIMVIDDVQNVGYTDNVSRARSAVPQSTQVRSLIDMGFVPVSSISSATATVKLLTSGDDGTKSIDVELRDDLLILETCADSTQTLISIANGLQPPIPQTEAVKYRTEVMPIQDMLASFSGDAFETDTITTRPEGVSDPVPIGEDHGRGEIEDELEYVSDFYPVKSGSDTDEFAGMTDSPTAASDSEDLLDSFHSQYEVSSSFSELDFQSDHFAKKSAVGGTAHRWDSTQNTYGLSNDSKLQRSPLRVKVRDAHVIWNLFDGYDWQRTRDTISKAVKDVEKKASERRARTGGSRASPALEEEEESVIGDCLFNSIYIGIPANKDPRDIRGDINRNIDDLVSETGSYATTTTMTGATARQSRSPSIRGKKLRLSRSKYHKMTFELKGICADFVVFPPDSEETQSSLDVRVNDLTIFDHVPTSTWKKFATYMHEAGEKESGTSMIHLEILTVKPVPELSASEIVLKATILPLRLHVDQDALDFLCRFFEFRDESAVSTPPAPGEVPFLQRAEVNSVPVKLDFKPKRVDYAGLRSGRTTEFMNFFVLDGADMVLRHVIIYGISGFDKLGQTLNDIWMPDVKRNQLPGVLAGLAPIRSLVNVGGGVKDLVVVPMREYQKDGRIVRSIQRGAISFAKTTSNELVKLGAKLAIGTQTVLQGAEDLLSTQNAAAQQPIPSAAAGLTEEDILDEEEAKKISLYADQPVGVVQGLRGAFTGLERDLLLARDAIVAVPGEVVESGSAKAAARAVWKRAPTVVLRPAIGVSKAVGQTLLGAGNTLDPANRRRMEDKYKRH